MTTKDTDHVTKGEFREFRDEMVEFKREMLGFKGDQLGTKEEIINVKGEISGLKGEIVDFKGQMNNFREAVFHLYDQQRDEYQRYVGALMEDNRSQIQMLAESIQMHVEMTDRRFLANDSEHKLFHRRLSVVESEQ